jgi:hypothetical protein
MAFQTMHAIAPWADTHYFGNRIEVKIVDQQLAKRTKFNNQNSLLDQRERVSGKEQLPEIVNFTLTKT